MSVQSMITKTLNDINHSAQVKTEDKVRELVNEILNSEARIAELQKRVTICKETLKGLELPKPVAVEL